MALDDALKVLTDIDPRKSHIIELRYFGGLTVEETAEVLGVSIRTEVARGGLYEERLNGRLRRSYNAKRRKGF